MRKMEVKNLTNEIREKHCPAEEVRKRNMCLSLTCETRRKSPRVGLPGGGKLQLWNIVYISDVQCGDEYALPLKPLFTV
jgi:hypothetical protein